MTDKSRNSDTFILKARKDKGVAAGRGGEGRRDMDGGVCIAKKICKEAWENFYKTDKVFI